MEPLSNRATELLDQYREAVAPSAAQQQHMLDGLAEDVAAGDVPAYADVPPPEPVTGMSLAAKLGLLAVAGAVAIPVIGWLVGGDAQPPETIARPSVAPATTPEPTLAPAPPAPAPATAPAVAVPPGPSAGTDAEVPPTVDEVRAPAPKKVAAAKPTPKPAPEEAPETATPIATIDAEMRLVKAAQRAVGAGDAEGALAHVREHARRFPDGKLSQLRDLVRIDALCAAGATDRARAAAREFLADHPGSPHSDRVRRVCAKSP